MTFLSYKYQHNIFHLVNDLKTISEMDSSPQQKIYIMVLHVDVVLIESKISHYLFQITGFGGHIGFCAYRPPGGYPNLYVVVFEKRMPTPNTIPNCRKFACKS